MTLSLSDIVRGKKSDTPKTSSSPTGVKTPTSEAPKTLGSRPGYKPGDLDKESEPEQTQAKVVAPVNIDIKPRVSDPKLTNIVNDLYKGQQMKTVIGNGTTMAAIREEKRTREPIGGVFHTKKGNDYKQGLQNLLDGGLLNEADTAVAKALVSDLEDALK